MNKKLTVKSYNQPDVEVSLYGVAKAMDSKDFSVFLEEFCNSYSCEFRNGQEVGRALHSTHRTLQATIFRYFLGVICGLGEQEYTDPRNEVAVKTAKKIAEMIKKGELEIGYMI